MSRYGKQKVHRTRRGVRIRPWIPLTDVDIRDYNSLDLDTMSMDDLKKLRRGLEDLRCLMERCEPADHCSIEHRFWDRRLSKVDDFLGGILYLLERLGDTTSKGPVSAVFRRLPAAAY